MPGLGIFIAQPTEGTIVGRNLTVSGSIALFGGALHGVSIQLGHGGPVLPVSGSYSWHWEGTLPTTAQPGLPFAITVRASGTKPPPYGSEQEPEDIDGERVVTVVPEAVPPELVIHPFESPVTAAQLPYAFVLSGTVRDAPGVASGLRSVQYQLGDGPFLDVQRPNGDGPEWMVQLPMPAGEHRFTVRAIDGVGNVTTRQRYLIVRLPVEPTAIDQVFEITTYLRALERFAERYITINGGAGPDAAALAARFLQPFALLTRGDMFERATAPVHRARIAVEVLRRRLAQPVLPAIAQRFRRDAYEAMLGQLGTSHDELRLARTAPGAERTALAARLGLGLDAVRPDALDQITLSPDAVSDLQLESLFGLASLASTEPLPPAPPTATLLIWQRDALHRLWQQQDAAGRDLASGARPVIDPDLIAAGHFVVRQAEDAAYALWTARSAWIADTLQQIATESQVGDSELARFDHVVGHFIVGIDIAALAASDAEGVDIQPALRALNLTPEAFSFLTRCRAVLLAGSTLQSEWDDVRDILLQVSKRGVARNWRAQERAAGVVLEPQRFQFESSTTAAVVSAWRRDLDPDLAWRRTLAARGAQMQSVDAAYQTALDAVESQTLPALRDDLIAQLGAQASPPVVPELMADRLSRELAIDLRSNVASKLARVEQAIETLQGVIFSVRAGRLGAPGSAGVWAISTESTFDLEWAWLGSYRTWLASERAFAYPENQLQPTLFVTDPPHLAPTAQYADHIARLRRQARLTPTLARTLAANYLAALRAEALRADTSLTLPAALTKPEFTITDQRSERALVDLQKDTVALTGTSAAHALPAYQWEVFWFVPMSLALALQEAGHYLAALDWYQCVFAFNLPAANRKIWHALAKEAEIASNYERVPEWLLDQSNPHTIAQSRKNAYTRFTVHAIVSCLLRYADSEFARNSVESIGRARTLYETGLDLLALPDAQPAAAEADHYPPNPVWAGLALRAQTSLGKIHNGLNTAGLPAEPLGANQSEALVLPSAYRSGVLVERAKSYAGMAQQIEGAYLSALEMTDSSALTFQQASQGMELARSSMSLLDIKVSDSDIGLKVAELQMGKAKAQVYHLRQLLNTSSSLLEKAQFAASVVGKALSNDIRGVASSIISRVAPDASVEKQQEAWRFELSQAKADERISNQQILLAQNQRQLARGERQQAALQLAHAEAVLDFLATKFTNTELFEWMSGVLGGVYAYFLQQATALAQLAQAQLAFERQEPSLAFIATDYWQDTAQASPADSTNATTDRRGLTGSARLQQDIYRLDQFAFETDRRKLHLTQTLSLSQMAAYGLQQFRDTGVLVFATPMEMFDREFPGHYLRLIKRVRVSMVALVPPVRGIRARLSVAGPSRVVVARDSFMPLVLQRPGEEIAFTSPMNATGLFEMEPDNGMLLPFEGMGVDAVWRLELPKPANPFDFNTIADVLITFDYTALDSWEYRQQVIQRLDSHLSADRAFSFRNQFADQWYDLHHSEQTATPMTVRFKTAREDFPPHVEDLTIQHIVLYFAHAKEQPFQDVTVRLGFKEHAAALPDFPGGEATSIAGIISTRRGNASSWIATITGDRTPIGEWQLTLPNTPQIKQLFAEEVIEDILLVITYAARTPEWPA